MVSRGLFGVFLAFALFAACRPPAFQSPPEPLHANPVIDADFPDPAVIRAPDGYYYAYATQTERNGKWVNLQVARSADLVIWQHLGDALPTKPGWASKTQDFWAPHVHHADGRYFLYYSAKPDAALTDEKRGLCLAVATAASPQGPFADMGKPLLCGETFVNIDPMAFDDPATGKRLLYWGSGFKPIKVQELAADRMSFAEGSLPVELVAPAKDAFPILVEGAWVTRRAGWYYLFYSGDNCCGPKANYAVMIARSRSATGPFQTLEQAKGIRDSIILAKHGNWHAPGHNSVATDEHGTDWMIFHAVDLRRPQTKPTDEVNTRRVMLKEKIDWRDGWPTVRSP